MSTARASGSYVAGMAVQVQVIGRPLAAQPSVLQCVRLWTVESITPVAPAGRPPARGRPCWAGPRKNATGPRRGSSQSRARARRSPLARDGRRVIMRSSSSIDRDVAEGADCGATCGRPATAVACVLRGLVSGGLSPSVESTAAPGHCVDIGHCARRCVYIARVRERAVNQNGLLSKKTLPHAFQLPQCSRHRERLDCDLLILLISSFLSYLCLDGRNPQYSSCGCGCGTIFSARSSKAYSGAPAHGIFLRKARASSGFSMYVSFPLLSKRHVTNGRRTFLSNFCIGFFISPNFLLFL